MEFIENFVFDGLDFTVDTLDIAHYDQSTFKDCNFSGISLHGVVFESCSFQNCTMDRFMPYQCSFIESEFTDCKLLGLDMTIINPFNLSIKFHQCMVDFSLIQKVDLRKCMFTQCSLKEIEFTDANLSSLCFDNCDLQGSFFDNCNLEKADFSTAYNFQIDPRINKMKAAKFSKGGLQGLLSVFKIKIV